MSKCQNPGRLLIINHEKFDNPKHNRPGSSQDVKLLKENFGKYKVRSKVISNPTYDEVLKEVNKMQKFDFTKNSCFVCAILSHGFTNNTIWSSDSKLYSLWDIVTPILRNESLFGKPKIFIVQACKGRISTDKNHNIILHDKLRAKKIDSNDLFEVNDSGKINPSNCFILYSTSEDFKAYRYTDTGTIFIKSFCYMLEKYGSTHNINKIFDLTIDDILRLKCLQQCPSKLIQGQETDYIFGDNQQEAST